MTRDEKRELIKELQLATIELDAAHDAVLKIFPTPDAPIIAQGWNMTAVAMKNVARLIGDGDGWLEWFVHENQWGKRAHEAGYGGDLRPITTIDDLLDLVEA